MKSNLNESRISAIRSRCSLSLRIYAFIAGFLAWLACVALSLLWRNYDSGFIADKLWLLVVMFMVFAMLFLGNKMAIENGTVTIFNSHVIPSRRIFRLVDVTQVTSRDAFYGRVLTFHYGHGHKVSVCPDNPDEVVGFLRKRHIAVVIVNKR